MGRSGCSQTQTGVGLRRHHHHLVFAHNTGAYDELGRCSAAPRSIAAFPRAKPPRAVVPAGSLLAPPSHLHTMTQSVHDFFFVFGLKFPCDDQYEIRSSSI
jgi:hypothetical protein